MAQPRAKLIPAEVTARFNALGLDSESAQARALDMAPSIHHRALKGARELSAIYALRLLVQLAPSVRDEVEALFEFPAADCDQVAS